MDSSAPETDRATPLVWEDAPSSRRQAQPSDYVLRTRLFSPLTVLGTAAALLVVMGLARLPPWGLVIGVIGGCLLGLMVTLAAMAWAVAIVFADDTRRGLWFVLFPPYMVVYAVQRWNWMAQPTVLFLCGLALAFGSPYAAGLYGGK